MKRHEKHSAIDDAIELRMSDLRLIRDMLLFTPDELAAMDPEQQQRAIEIGEMLDMQATEQFSAVLFTPDKDAGTDTDAPEPDETDRFVNCYHCWHCGEFWKSHGACRCNDRCPDCDAENAPYESVDL